jgi:ABC-type transporter Mla MlaB component
MSVEISFIPEERRLDLYFEGNLDVSVWQDVWDTCRRASPNLRSCIVDLTGVDRVFDSGIALLGMLCRRLRQAGATVIFLSDDSEIKRRVSLVASPGWYTPSVVS